MSIVLGVVVLYFVSLILHEYAHARVAFAGGDISVVDKGYLTLNPLKYIHPVMSIILPIIILIIGGIPLPGAAVYIETHRIRSKAWISWTAAAGPLSGVAILLLIAIPTWFGLHTLPAVANSDLPLTLGAFAFITSLLVVLNALPFPPLDGYGVLEPWLPESWQRQVRELGSLPMFALLFLMIMPGSPLRTLLLRGAALLLDLLALPRPLVVDGFNAFLGALGR